MWLLTAWRLAGEYERPRRAAALDLLGNLLGGIAVAIPGIVWLVASGAWSGFLEVFQKWNPYYMRLPQEEMFTWRYTMELFWFPVWSLGLILTVPLALVSVLDAAFWLKRTQASIPVRPGPLSRWLPWYLWDKPIGRRHTFCSRRDGRTLSRVGSAVVLRAARLPVCSHSRNIADDRRLGASHRWAWTPLVLLWLTVTSGLWVAADFSPQLEGQLGVLPE